MYIFGSHSHENFSSNYCWNGYERENLFSLSKDVEEH